MPPTTPRADHPVGTTSFTYRGATFTIDDPTTWMHDVLEALEANRLPTAIRRLLGPAQYAAFRATQPRIGDLMEFFAALGNAVGRSFPVTPVRIAASGYGPPPKRMGARKIRRYLKRKGR